MLLTVLLILPIMSMLSALTRSTARTFNRTTANRAPALFARGEHTLPKLPYAYDVSLDSRLLSRRPLEARSMLIPSDWVV